MTGNQFKHPVDSCEGALILSYVQYMDDCVTQIGDKQVQIHTADF